MTTGLAVTAPPAVVARTVVIAPLPPEVGSLVSDVPLPLELLDALPVPLSEIVIASWALDRVKAACTVSAMVPLAAVEVR